MRNLDIIEIMYIIILIIIQFINFFTQAEGAPKQSVMHVARSAYKKAKEDGITSSPIVTVIDYELSSNKPRMWIIDIENNEVLEKIHVAHGRAPVTFIQILSNEHGSHKSSIGVFVAGQPYIGKHGRSIRLKGLEDGFNDNAYDRSIVIHKANYVHDYCPPDKIRCNGRSHGCPAVSPESMKIVSSFVKPGNLVIAYYPDTEWLNHSEFLD